MGAHACTRPIEFRTLDIREKSVHNTKQRGHVFELNACLVRLPPTLTTSSCVFTMHTHCLQQKNKASSSKQQLQQQQHLYILPSW